MENMDAELNEAELASGLEKKKKFSGKQIVLFAVLPLVGLGVIAALALTVLGGSEPKTEDLAVAGKAESAEPQEILFYDLPEMLVNLNTGGRKASYLKITVALEVDRSSTIAELDAKLPRIVDNFQVYLRELRVEDLNGSAGMFRLKEELLARVNTSLYPTEVKDVLFKEMLVQ